MTIKRFILRVVLTIIFTTIFVIITYLSPINYIIRDYALYILIIWIISFLLSYSLFPVGKWLTNKHALLMSHIFGFILALLFSFTLIPSVLPYLVRYLFNNIFSHIFNNLTIISPLTLSVHVPKDSAIFVFWLCIIDILLAVIIFTSITYFEKKNKLSSKWKFWQIAWAMLIPSIIAMIKNLINIYHDSYVGTSVLIILLLIIGNMTILDSRRISMQSKKVTNKSSVKDNDDSSKQCY